MILLKKGLINIGTNSKSEGDFLPYGPFISSCFQFYHSKIF